MEEWRTTLTAKEIEHISTLKNNILDIIESKHDDVYLFRFLKARKFDLKKAEAMIRDSEKWRTEFGADTILDTWEPPEVMQRYWPGGIFGCDNLGHPILWQMAKDFNSKDMMKCVKKQDIIKYHVWRMEKLVKACNEASTKTGRIIYKSMHISDLDGFTMAQIFTPGMSDAMKEVFAVLEANYPENLHTSYVINAPGIFPTIFNILRPFLSQETKNKVHILGSNWQSELSKAVEPSQLPVYWGGTATYPDDKCTDHISYGAEIPTNLHISEQLAVNRDRMKTITVIRGSTYNLTYDVKRPGTVISWIFESDRHDIDFAILHSADRQAYAKKDMTSLRAPSRYNSHLSPEHGTQHCAHTGVYILQFDNSYSWVTNKQLRVDVEMLEPDEDMKKIQEQLNRTNTVLTNGVTNSLETTHL